MSTSSDRSSGGERTRIQLCGRLSVEVDGVQVAPRLRGKQVPLLLAYLLLNRERHLGREELIGALWPERAPLSQDAALRTLLSRLRSGLGPDALSGRDELILTLPEPVWIDLEAAGTGIERAQRSLDHNDPRSAWALAQVPLNIAGRGLLPGAQADWLEPPRRELEEIRLQALETIGRAGLHLGGSQLASAERAARSLIEFEPYRESGYVLLMEALTAMGNVAEAVRVFERLRTLLREELGTSPGPETIAAHDRLLQPSATSGGSERQATQSSVRIELPPELQLYRDSPLVGRQQELSELARLWLLAGEPGEQHHARIVLLMGDPGIGKTRLVAELAGRAHDGGAFVLAGRSPEESLVPYQPFVEALRHYVLNTGFAELRATAREYGAELARLVPELRRRAPELPPPIEGEPETERYRLFEAVVGLLNEISAAAPVLLVLDDLQWADRPTLLLLRHLARSARPGRVLLLGAYRATEATINGFAEALSEMRHDRLVAQIHLDGLTEAETAELVQLRAGRQPTPDFARALHVETEGNPFFVEEIIKHLAEAGVQTDRASKRELERFGLPEGIKRVIARRLARLDAQSMELLRVATVIGRDFDISLLERVVELEENEFLNALDAALAAGLIAESPVAMGRYSFTHALIRETLYEGLSPPRRARIHRRVGGALETTRGEKQLTALALHFARAAGAEEAEKAIEYAMLAGEQATALLAHEEAAGHYARAIEVLERFEPDQLERRAELLNLLGEAQVCAGERVVAGASFVTAGDIATRLGDSANLARAAIGASRRYVQEPGVVDEQLITMLRRALEMTAQDRTLTRVKLLSRMCGAIYYSSERGHMREYCKEASAIANELADPEAQAYAWAAQRRANWEPAHLPARLEASTELLRCARQIGNLELELQAHAWLVVDLLEHGDREAVDAQMTAFTDGAQRLRQPQYLWQAEVWRAMRALIGGRLEEAERFAGEALRIGASAEQVTAPQYFAIQLMAIRREQQRFDEIEQPARELVASNPERPAWRTALMTLLWETGQLEQAREHLDALATQDFEDIPRDGDWLITMSLIAEGCARLEDSRRAELVYELLVPCSDGNVVAGFAVVCFGSVERYLGALAHIAGREQRAAEHFERALAANSLLKAPVAMAHSSLDYALLLGPRSARGRDLVGGAAQMAKELSLPAISARAADLGGG